jgi:hypothetical protein
MANPPEAPSIMPKGIGGAIDAVGGSFAMRYATMVVTAVRAGSGAQVPQ